MRKIKRIIALITVAMFLLSLAAPAASAATKEEAFGRLNSLSVAVGDATGNPQYDKNFTRAEAAAIMVNLSGMKAAIDAAKGATKFKDVPASHWASGVVNLAVGAGIIKGFPDGTYRPDENVTYAQMSAMLVGVLGYTPKLQGTWPSNVIGKAAQLGLLDGVNVTDYNAAAVRSNVFLAADNTLDTKPLKETKDGYEEDTKTLMESKLAVTKKAEGTVTVVPNYGEKNKVTVKVDATTNYTVNTLESLDANSLYGEKVVPWVKDDKAFFFDRKNSADVIRDKKVLADSPVGKIHLDSKDRTYTYSADMNAYINYTLYTKTSAPTAAAQADLLGDSAQVKLVLDGDGNIAYLESFTYNQALVKDVNTTDEKINAKVGTSLDLKSKTYAIIKDGKNIGIGDIKANDVIDVAQNGAGDRFMIYVTSAPVTGKVEGVGNGANPKITIAGKTYNSIAPQVSTNGGSSYGGNTSDVQGQNVTAYMNKDGKVCYMVADAAATSNFFPVVVKSIAADGTVDKNVWMKVAKIDGTNTSYQVTKDTKLDGVKLDNDAVDGLQAVAPNIQQDQVPGSRLAAGTLVVKIELTTDGKVDEIKNYTLNTDKFVVASPVPISKTNDTLDGYKKDDNSKFAYLYNDGSGDYKSMTWAGMESLEAASNVARNMTIIVDKGIIKYVFITTAMASAADYSWGYVKDYGSYDATLDSDWTDIYVNGEVKRFKTSVGWKKKVIEFKISDNEIEAAFTAPAAAYAINPAWEITSFTLLDINESANLIQIRPAADVNDARAAWVSYDKGMKVYYDGNLKDLSYAKSKTVKLYDVWNDKGEQGQDLAYDFMIVQ